MEKENKSNNIVWKKIFSQYHVLEEIKKKSFFMISSKEINKYGKEARLMAKYDRAEDLPEIFKENNLAILPIKRGYYIIGKFKNYQSVEINNNEDVAVKYLPDYVTTIDCKNITIESTIINAAYISGMLSDLVGEDVIPTVAGRMGTANFDYEIMLENNNTFNISVEKSQIEIDGSYEGVSKYIILEAKNRYMEDFIIRQLYYPYRKLKNITDKEIIPVMLIKHDNVFNFYIYSFEDVNKYNSIKLKKTKRYILEEIPEQIEYNEVEKIMNEITFVDEDSSIPFPQANSFNLFLDLLYRLNSQNMSKKEVIDFIEYVPRQSNYYLNAGKYLGLVKKEDKMYCLTDYGKKIMNLSRKARTMELISLILSHRPFFVAMHQYMSNFEFDDEEIAKSIYECRGDIKHETANRRTGGVKAWIKWIFNEIKSIDDLNL